MTQAEEGRPLRRRWLLWTGLAAVPSFLMLATTTELTRDVVRLARGEGSYFSFLDDSKARIEVVLGDGRISLERELTAGSRQFDVLVIDVFNGNAILVHLLTQGTFELYLKHLRRPTGVLVVHLSNRNFQLIPVVWELVRSLGASAVVVAGKIPDLCDSCDATWMAVSMDPVALEHFREMEGASARLKEARTSLWTDDFASLFRVMK